MRFKFASAVVSKCGWADLGAQLVNGTANMCACAHLLIEHHFFSEAWWNVDIVLERHDDVRTSLLAKHDEVMTTLQRGIMRFGHPFSEAWWSDDFLSVKYDEVITSLQRDMMKPGQPFRKAWWSLDIPWERHDKVRTSLQKRMMNSSGAKDKQAIQRGAEQTSNSARRGTNKQLSEARNI